MVLITVKFNLISVDDEADAYAGNNIDYTNVKVKGSVPKQRFVVEEGTGTWCGWCPRGYCCFPLHGRKISRNLYWYCRSQER